MFIEQYNTVTSTNLFEFEKKIIKLDRLKKKIVMIANSYFLLQTIYNQTEDGE
jgi:hypothetical protein